MADYTPGIESGAAYAAALQKAREKERDLRARLQEMFEEKAVPFDESWRVEVKVRATGTSLGTSDAYYFSPVNKRYRSRQEIARDYGLVDGGGAGGSRPGEPKSGAKRNRKSEGGAAAAAAAHSPLTRADALAEAAKRREAFALPHRLSCGVTVTRLGTLRPLDPAYCNGERLWPAGFEAEWEDEKGVRFINSITETPSGPIFRIKAQRMPHDGKPATEVVELGAGSSPDAAYADAEERQSEALEIALLNRSIKHRGHESDPTGSPVAPAGRALDAAEHLLVKCRPLESHWGLERFGLADASVLQALEGLPGLELCPAYRLVDERLGGGWVAETRRLNAELAARGKQELQLPMPTPSAAPAQGTPGGDGGSAPKKRGPRPSRKEAEENAVRRILDIMVKQAEMDEVRAVGLEAKARAKAEKDAERLRKRADKERMHDAMQKLKEQQRLQAKAALMEAQRRQAELNATIDDCELPGASEPPPQPGPIATGRLPTHQQPVLLEAWQFVSRFGEQLLGLPAGSRMPSLQQLEAALLGEAPPPPPPPPQGEESGGMGGVEASPQLDAAEQLLVPLTEFLVSRLFHDTAQAIVGSNPDITLADLRGPGRHMHPLSIRKETWQEAARRYLTVLATTAMTQAKEGAPPGSVAPLSTLDPFVVLQFLTAGPPSSLTQGAAVLPRGAARLAGHCITARTDAAAVASAHRAFADVAGGAGPAGSDTVAAQTRLLRCLLKEIFQATKHKKGDGRVMSFCGQAAAAAGKVGRPLDLRGVAARIDAGVYTALPDPLHAFAADVRYAAGLLQAGCNKQASLFAQEYCDRAGPELAAMAVSKVDAALRELEVTGPEDFLAQHAPLPVQRRPRPTPEPASQQAAAAAAAAGETPGSGAATREGSAEPASQAAGEEEAGGRRASRGDGQGPAGMRQVTDPIRDLDRPYAPVKEPPSGWRGCVVCWNNEDPLRLLACDACDCQTHSYCLEPPLEEPPQQTEPFLCGRCRTLQPGAPSGGRAVSIEFARSSDGGEAWRLAQLLATLDFSEWEPEDRCALLRLLSTLSAESGALHDYLHGDEGEVRERRKEIASLQAEVKKLQGEMRAQQGGGAAAAGSGAAPGSAGVVGAAGGSAPPSAATSPLPPLPPARATRRARDPQAEIEGMVEKISYLEAAISNVGPVRLEPVGLDRNYNRYWLLPAAAAATDPANPPPPEAPPLLVVERHSLDSLTQAGAAAAAAALGSATAGAGGDAAGGGAGWQVGAFSSILHLQQLAQWLNPKGSRERPLSEVVTRLLDQHQGWAMRHVQPRARMDEGAAEAQPGAASASALRALRSALLTFEEGNQAGTYDDLAGSEPRREIWRAMVSAAGTPATFMQALLVLEHMIRPQFLKTHWRPYAQPAPHPDDICTLPAVWMRLDALKASVRLKVTINMRLAKEAGALFGGAGTRYSLRDAKPTNKRGYYEGPGSHADSGADSGDDGQHETRAERAAKRAAQRHEPDDEALARELDAELNAGGRRTRGGQARPAAGAASGDDVAEWEEEQEGQEEDNGSDVDVSMDDADASG